MCRLTLQPRYDFSQPFRAKLRNKNTAVFGGVIGLALWCSRPISIEEDRVETEFELCAGQEVCCAFGPDEESVGWTTRLAVQAMQCTLDYWRDWLSPIEFSGSRRAQIRRSTLLVHLFTFAETGAVIAAPTASLPARIGGARNYDYRFTWIRDASLSLALLAKLGSTDDAKRFMHWLAGLKSKSEMPLQVLYRIDGGCEAPVVGRDDICGYRGSRPVRFGNRAVSMFEIDSFGYLADCALIYLDHGGRWESEFWDLIRRIADFTAGNWHRRGSSIWEITPEQHFVVGKVMSWVTLDRALRIAGQTGQQGPFIKSWKGAREQIHSEIMTRAWSERLASFRQRYDADSVDAALLLIPIVGFLPVDHPRVSATIERIIQHLEINGFLHRFIPKELPGQGTLPLGEEEGAFLMCSFWLSQVFVLRGEIEHAESILTRAEAVAPALGLFADAIDARNNSVLGNTPLLFSQVEYAKAVVALAEAQKKCAGEREGPVNDTESYG